MKKLVRNFHLILVIILSNFMVAQKADAPKFLGNTEGVKEYSLQNGMKLLLIPDGSQSNMIVNIIYNVGSKFTGTYAI